VPESVRDGLQGDGFAVSSFVPQLLRSSDIAPNALVISFDQDVPKPVATARYLHWGGLPSVLADYAQGRDAIVKRVDALIDELARSRSP
jgi:hypothetical protein